MKRLGQFVMTTNFVVASGLITKREFYSMMENDSMVSFKTTSGNHVNIFPHCLRSNIVHFVNGQNVLDRFDEIKTQSENVQIVIPFEGKLITSKVMALKEAHHLLLLEKGEYLSFPSSNDNDVVLFPSFYEMHPIYFINVCNAIPDLYDQKPSIDSMDRRSLVKFIKDHNINLDTEDLDTDDIRKSLKSLFKEKTVAPVILSEAITYFERLKDLDDTPKNDCEKLNYSESGCGESRDCEESENYSGDCDGCDCENSDCSGNCDYEDSKEFENLDCEDDSEESEFIVRKDILPMDRKTLLHYLEDLKSHKSSDHELLMSDTLDLSELSTSCLRNLFLREEGFFIREDIDSMSYENLVEFLECCGFSISDDSEDDMREYAVDCISV